MYQNTYFYIDSKYKYGVGFPCDADGLAFHMEAKRIFKSIGWEVKSGRNRATSPSAFKGKQELYLHPMMFSGVILTEDVPEIECAISGAKTFRLRNIGRFQQYEDMSDEKYGEYLDTRKDAMIEAILETLRTKRRNLYHTGNLGEKIGQNFRLYRLQAKDNYAGDLAYLRVSELIADLVAEGKLIEGQTKNGPGYRTATKKDLAEVARKTK